MTICFIQFVWSAVSKQTIDTNLIRFVPTIFIVCFVIFIFIIIYNSQSTTAWVYVLLCYFNYFVRCNIYTTAIIKLVQQTGK